MPIGARRLYRQIEALNAVRKTLRLASDSPTGLRWRDDYRAVRVVPGGVAGSDNGRQYIVTCDKFPLYCRHAVWMLANDALLPEGHDVAFLDGNTRNLDVDNLSLTSYEDAVYGPRERKLAKERTARTSAPDLLPRFVQFQEHRGGQFLLRLSYYRSAQPIYVARNEDEAFFALTVVAEHLGYLTKYPEVMERINKRVPNTLPLPTRQLIRDIVDEIRARSGDDREMTELQMAKAEGIFMSCWKLELQRLIQRIESRKMARATTELELSMPHA